MANSEHDLPDGAQGAGPEEEPAWQAQFRQAKVEADEELRRIHRESQEQREGTG